MHLRRIEEASLNAWPALQQVLFDGWILRFSKGYTKRANSVNPLFDSSMDLEEKVDACEQFYADKGLQTIFRLPSFCSPPGLDQVLERRSYSEVAPTLVLHLDLRNRRFQTPPSVQLREEDLDDWMDIFCRCVESPVDKHQTHKEILAAIPSRRFLASLEDAGQIVACGLGILEHGYFGLFDLITDPGQRNKGYGTKLVSSLLGWAQDNGGQRAYLQVVGSNAPARHLYAKFEFEEAYRYWYRVAAA
jgi:ribosomal protein S18 acetylase RimI-like enzyme